MEHYFNLPVSYKGVDRAYAGRLVTFGYTFKFHIVVDKKEIIFERDDQMQFRAINLEPDDRISVEPGLLDAIVSQLEKLSDN